MAAAKKSAARKTAASKPAKSKRVRDGSEPHPPAVAHPTRRSSAIRSED